MLVDVHSGQGEGTRIASLDGLRGLAALAVVLCHCMLTSPTILESPSHQTEPAPPWEWWAARTPLRLLWAGDEAVIVFFALSGLVLTLPFLAGATHWPAYYVRRMIRLYPPVWASLAITVALMIAVPRAASAAQSDWVHDHVVPLTPGEVVREASLWSPTATLNEPLWSLHYEIIFSLLLPLYVAAGLVLRRWWVAKLGVLLATIAVGSVANIAALQYMPIFGVGVVLAVEQERIKRWAYARSRWQWGILFGAAAFLMLVNWIGLPGYVLAATIGAGVLIVGFQHCLAARRVGEFRATQWLGKRSFSLYLVHLPIVLATIVLTGATSPELPILIGLPCSLVVAALMYVLVERPAHQLARGAGYLVERHVRPTRAASPR